MLKQQITLSAQQFISYRVIFLSSALFNICMSALFIIFYQDLLFFIGHNDITQNSLARLFVQLFGLAVLLFAGVYTWIGLYPNNLLSFPLGVIAFLGKAGVFFVMSGSAAANLVSWQAGPLFSIIDGIYAILFAVYILSMRRIIYS
jgi:hypothetical protein